MGHAGTLDPLATGVLILAVGPATRFLQYLPLEPKVYVAEIKFGQSTTTYDAEGELSDARPIAVDLLSAVEASLPTFRGLIQQMPPMYSAVKVGGKALYKYAREGKTAEREARTVHISSFEVEVLDENSVRARIVCSGGTYIRSLANDLGEAIGCGAHLTGLIRTDVGRYSIEQTQPLDQVSPQDLIPLHEALLPMPLIQLDDVQTSFVREGRPIAMADPPAEHFVALLEPRGTVFSIAKLVGNLLQPECVIPSGVPHGSA